MRRNPVSQRPAGAADSAPSQGAPPAGPTPEAWAEIKRFLEFDAEDERRLRDALERYGPHIEEIVERFYDHLLAHEATRSVLSRAEVDRRLKDLQRGYLRSLAGGDYGDGYLRDRLRIGATHERIGLAPRWYLGAYWLYLRDITPRLLPCASPAERETMLSLHKALLLDMILVTEAYVGRTLALVRDQKSRLEELVSERTRQLSKWERLAAVGSMAAKVAHEIRNPLSSISLNTELLNDELVGYRGVDTSEAVDLLRAIAGEIDRLSRIVEEYLQFARMPRLDLEQVDLKDLAEQVLKFLGPEFERYSVVSEVDAPGTGPTVYLDRNQFRQVLLNLLRNSQEAMPEGGKVTIRLREEADGGIEVVVVDTGIGLEPAQTQQVFDPFFSTKDTGTGLGLAFVQQVVLEHGGEVSCTGQPGRGAAFRIVLPERLRVRSREAPRTTAAEPGTAPPRKQA
jgi:signal transduction histidine kinase